MTVDERRKITLDEIAKNPVTVTIHRVVKVDDGAGGWVPQESDLEAQTMRLFIMDRRRTESTSEGGQQQLSQWGLLAAHNADIQHGTGVEDSFSLPERGKFLVKQVIPVLYLGEVVSKQVVLEELT